MAIVRKPKSIIVKEYGKFIHEVINPSNLFPKSAKFRTIKVNSHRVTVGYWGKQIAPGKHEYYAINKILHPKKHGEPCKLKDRLKLLGIKSLELGKEYEVTKKLPKLTGKRRGGKLLKKNPKLLCENPYYIGRYKRHYADYMDENWDIFTAPRKPTKKVYGKKYMFVIGPFKTYNDAIDFLATKV